MREAGAQSTAHTVCFARRAAIKMASGPGHDTLAIIQLLQKLQKQPWHVVQTQLDAARLIVALGQVRLTRVCITLEISGYHNSMLLHHPLHACKDNLNAQAQAVSPVQQCSSQGLRSHDHDP